MSLSQKEEVHVFHLHYCRQQLSPSLLQLKFHLLTFLDLKQGFFMATFCNLGQFHQCYKFDLEQSNCCLSTFQTFLWNFRQQYDLSPEITIWCIPCRFFHLFNHPSLAVNPSFDPPIFLIKIRAFSLITGPDIGVLFCLSWQNQIHSTSSKTSSFGSFESFTKLQWNCCFHCHWLNVVSIFSPVFKLLNFQHLNLSNFCKLSLLLSRSSASISWFKVHYTLSSFLLLSVHYNENLKV
jgi:hypothetical protein